jgi:hypothetical protein
MNLTKFRARWLLGSTVLGVGCSLLAPADWFLYAFLGACGLALIAAMACSIDAKDSNPLTPGQQVVSYFLLGTDRPRARIPESNAVVAFQCFAVLAVSLVAGMLIRASA